MMRKKKRFDYGDYYNKPALTAQEGSVGQAASPYYTSQNLNTLSLPENKNNNQWFNNNQGALAAAGTAVGEGLSATSGQMVDTDYTSDLNKAKKLTKTIGTAASAINPLIGAGVAIGSGIGAQTVDEYGQYKSSVGNAIDEQVNPVTGVQGVLRAFKGNQSASGFLNKLTVGLFGKSDNQKEAEKGKAEFERTRLAAIRKRSEQNLADYPIFGFAKGGKYPMGGMLPYPTDNSEANQLASNVVQYEGSTHQNGGIDLDINNDGAAEIEVENKEVIKDNMVLSNRLKPSKEIRGVAKELGIKIGKRETYATLAAKIGKKKGDFEEQLNSGRVGSNTTAQIMINRLDANLDMLFMDQQVRKNNKGATTKFPGGGLINPTPKVSPTLAPDYLKIDPRNNTAQAELKAKINLENALRFKNTLRGNVVPQVPSDPDNSTGYLSGTSVINSYNSVDPTVLQKADSTINASRAFLKQPLLASRAKGGYLPKYAKGNPIGALKVKDPITGEFYENDYSPNLATPESPAFKYQPIVEGRAFDIGDYKGDIAAGIGTIANQIQIGRMETNFNPETIDKPQNFYTDRTGFLTDQINQQYRTATQGLNNSSSQDNQALKANLYAKSLSGLNQALDAETQRKDAISSRYADLVNRTDYFNANIKNQGKLMSMQNRNEKRALTQQNLDNLIRSYIGNEAGRDIKANQFSQNYMTAAMSGERGVSERYINSLPKQTRRRLGYK